MTHNRFFVSPSQISQTHIKITDTDNLHHIRVIRLGINDMIIVLDGSGNEYHARISSMSREITAEIVDKKVYPSPTLQITIVQSIPKLDKADFIVEKCTELGVSRIVFVETSRSVKKQVNLSRLEKIAISASSQSGRIFLPMIEEARFCDALAMVSQEMRNAECGMRNNAPLEKEAPPVNILKLMLWENAEKGIGEVLRLPEWLTLPEGLPPAIGAITRVALFVGPEGGFSQEEADEAVRKGIIPISLGKQILRTETAGLVGLTIVAYEMGLLN